MNVTLCVLSAINKSILNHIIEQIPDDQFKREEPEDFCRRRFSLLIRTVFSTVAICCYQLPSKTILITAAAKSILCDWIISVLLVVK
jgi:hypothetical protein